LETAPGSPGGARRSNRRATVCVAIYLLCHPLALSLGKTMGASKISLVASRLLVRMSRLAFCQGKVTTVGHVADTGCCHSIKKAVAPMVAPPCWIKTLNSLQFIQEVEDALNENSEMHEGTHTCI